MDSLSLERGTSVLIIEPRADGHHGPYLEWMALGLAERGFRVTVATSPQSMNHPSFRALAEDSERIRIVAVSDLTQGTPAGRLLGSVARELSYWRLFRKCYKDLSESVQPDIVLLPYLDYCLYAIGLLGSPFKTCPWTGIAMRPSFHYREMGVIAPWPALAGIKKRLFLRMLRNQHLRHLLTIDEPLVEYLSRHHKTSCKAIFFPEPIGWSDLPDIRDAKKQLGVPLHRKLILVYGAITERKGVEELLQAMNSAEFPSSVDVLLAGKQSPKIRELIRESWTTALVAQRKLICLDRFVEGSEEPCLFAAADIVWLGYREHYTSSGVLAQAVGADRPIIACKEGIIGWQAERHKLGAVISTTEIHEIIAGINAILSEEDSHGERRHFRPCSDISTACDSLKDALHSRLSR